MKDALLDCWFPGKEIESTRQTRALLATSWKKLSISIMGIRNKLRRLSTVGSTYTLIKSTKRPSARWASRKPRPAESTVYRSRLSIWVRQGYLQKWELKCYKELAYPTPWPQLSNWNYSSTASKREGWAGQQGFIGESAPSA